MTSTNSSSVSLTGEPSESSPVTVARLVVSSLIVIVQVYSHVSSTSSRSSLSVSPPWSASGLHRLSVTLTFASGSSPGLVTA